MTSPLLELSQVSKSFPPAVRALADIHFTLIPGEVHALVGENGAGKSTLSRIIAGIEPPTTGTMLLNNTNYTPTSRKTAEAAGVRMVMQELNLLPTLSVAENLFLHRLPHRFGIIHRKKLHQLASDALHAVGLEILNPDTPAGMLGIGQQQLIEIAAGLTTHCRLLILDEPTAALSDREAELLFTQIARLKQSGVAILYISHRMPEIARLADRITILRDGHLIATRPAANFPLPEIIRLMVGREIATATLDKKPPSPDIALEARHLAAPPTVHDVSLTLHRGEILGLAGLMGSGRTETLRLLFGADPRTAGTIHLRGNPTPARIRSPRDAVANGIALLTEDRKAQGLLLPWSIRQNTTLPSLSAFRNPIGFIRTASELKAAAAQATALDIRSHSLEQTARELSGGNQQKVVLAKWLLKNPDILLFDEPTRGIDVGAKFEIYRLLIALAAQGKALLVVSSELPELIALCHRIAVLSAGTLVQTFEPPFNPDTLLSAALTHHVTRTPAKTPA